MPPAKKSNKTLFIVLGAVVIFFCGCGTGALLAGNDDKTPTAVGMRNLPSKDWDVNTGWIHTAAIAIDLLALTRLLGLHDVPDLAQASPDTLRYRTLHIPGRLARHARRRILHLAADWPWTTPILTCWTRLCQLAAPG